MPRRISMAKARLTMARASRRLSRLTALASASRRENRRTADAVDGSFYFGGGTKYFSGGIHSALPVLRTRFIHPAAVEGRKVLRLRFLLQRGKTGASADGGLSEDRTKRRVDNLRSQLGPTNNQVEYHFVPRVVRPRMGLPKILPLTVEPLPLKVRTGVAIRHPNALASPTKPAARRTGQLSTASSQPYLARARFPPRLR